MIVNSKHVRLFVIEINSTYHRTNSFPRTDGRKQSATETKRKQTDQQLSGNESDGCLCCQLSVWSEWQWNYSLRRCHTFTFISESNHLPVWQTLAIQTLILFFNTLITVFIIYFKYKICGKFTIILRKWR